MNDKLKPPFRYNENSFLYDANNYAFCQVRQNGDYNTVGQMIADALNNQAELLETLGGLLEAIKGVDGCDYKANEKLGEAKDRAREVLDKYKD